MQTCELELDKECGADFVTRSMLMDDCGAHAMPYHAHTDLLCEYNASASSHSDLVCTCVQNKMSFVLRF